MASNEKTMLGVVLVGLILVGSYLGYDHFLKDDVVEVDDIVQINYIAWIEETDTVFATTIVNEYDITMDTVLDESHRYRSISVTVGPGEASKGTIKVIEGLDEGLLGRKVGDIFEITIPPEKGYLPDPELILEVDRTLDSYEKEQSAALFQAIDRIYAMTTSEYAEQYGKEAQVGDIVNLVSWLGNVTAITEDVVYIQGNPDIGTVVDALPWNMEVTEVSEDAITLTFLATVGETYENAYGSILVNEVTDTEILFYQDTLNDQIETIYGMADIVDLGENFELYIIPEEGKVISSADGYAKIKNITETSFDLDFNSGYIGVDIVYKVKVENIIKAEG